MMEFSPRPNTVFWELTRRCRHRCLHCRLGDTMDEPELSLTEKMSIAANLIELQPKFVVLTGGEPTLALGWNAIAEKLSIAGIKVRLFISGTGFDETTLRQASAAGVRDYAVSLDGPEAVHDRLRPPHDPQSPSSFAQAVAAMRMLREAKMAFRVVTQVNALNVDRLDEIYDLVVDHGAARWQIHVCQISGRAVSHRDRLMLHPDDLEKIVAVLQRAAQAKRVIAPLHCTVGYLTEEEPLYRNRLTAKRAVWEGCTAGLRTFAVTASGKVKGCVALPDSFCEPSEAASDLSAVWRDETSFPYTRRWTPDVLGEHCSACVFAPRCRAGCPAVAYGATGSIGANPYCLRLVRGKQ